MIMAMYPLSHIILILLLSTISLSFHNKNNAQHITSLHFTGYLHEKFNKTIYFTFKGQKRSAKSASNPFGSLLAYNEPLTETPNPSSKLLGNMEGSGVTSSFNGDRMTFICRSKLKIKGYEGEILNVGSASFTKLSELPIVGGTGDFRFAQGYIIQSDMFKGIGGASYYKVDFHVYWPPFSVLAH
ncbi:dirigent protein 1-like [Amaranthus tricolor]|uniref:dirigent protein 1-like n=1 Tax=Amaranthus tricolor TaxID=29722 RepID=UPI00258458A7|nr:dirigent protein 1-like [Amaranthus tricolor]